MMTDDNYNNKQRNDAVQRFHWSEHEGKFGIETIQDESELIKSNQFLYNENAANKHARKRDALMGSHVARVSEVQLHKWQKEFQEKRNLMYPPRLTDPEFKAWMMLQLQSPEYRQYRVDGKKGKA